MAQHCSDLQKSLFFVDSVEGDLICFLNFAGKKKKKKKVRLPPNGKSSVSFGFSIMITFSG